MNEQSENVHSFPETKIEKQQIEFKIEKQLFFCFVFLDVISMNPACLSSSFMNSFSLVDY